MQRAFWRLFLFFLLVVPATLRGAPAGYALDFDGVDDSVEVNLGTERPLQDYTIGAWVYLRTGGTWTGKRSAVLSTPGCGGGIELLIRANGDNANDPQFLELGQCGAFNGAVSSIPVPLRTWTHVAVTVGSDRRVSYFINGEPAGSWVPGSDIPAAALQIGQTIRLGNNSEFRQFDGRLDGVILLSQALAPETIRGFYDTNFKGTEFPFMSSVFSFDEGSGGQLRDGAPAGGFTDGTLVGGPVWVRSGPMPPAVVRVEGTQQDFGGGWRTPASSMSRDVDGDQVFGTDGYQFVNLAPAKPGYLASMEPLTSSYAGNESYAFIDDPTNPGLTFMTGTQNPAPGGGLSADVFRFTLNAHAVGRLIRVGVMIDHLDNSGYNPASLRLVQVTGGVAATPPVATTGALYRNRTPDWVFFDISGGQTGDTFVLRGAGGAFGEVTVGGVVFDSLGANGGRIRVGQGATPSPYPSRIHIAGLGGDIGKLNLKLNGIRAGSPGFGVLLVGPGGQKVRPMVSAGAGFNVTEGATLTFDDFAAEDLPTPLEGTIPSGTYRPQTDQGLAGDLPAPAPAGPYPSALWKALDGPLNGVWSLYLSGFSGSIGSWSLDFVPAPPPTVTALPASGIFYETAILNGSVNTEGLPTTVWFEWASDQSPDFARTPLVNLGRGQYQPVMISNPLSGLTAGQAYQFYLVASNAASIRSTQILTFQTGTPQVSNPGDDGPGTLRAAIAHAPAGAVIDLRGLSGVLTLNTGPLVVRRDMTIVGPGAKFLAISGGGVQSLLNNGANLEISGVTLRDGIGDPQSGMGMVAPIVNFQRLTLLECAIVQNRSVGTGYGAIANLERADLRLTRCTLSGNQAVQGNGGVLRNSGGVSMVRQCTFSDNYASDSGGAVYSYRGLVDLHESTFSGNTAGTGGALTALGSLPGVTSLQLRNCLVAGNRSGGGGPDIAGEVYSAGGNLFGILDGAFTLYGKWGLPDRSGTRSAPLDARVLPLADNGGPTLTMALLPDSPAIDVGGGVVDPASDGFDQRGKGFGRRNGFGLDVGAYELQVADPAVPVIRIDERHPNAVDGLYLSWPTTMVGGQPVAWPLYRKASLDPGVPWVLVDSSTVYWNEATRRWRHVDPKESANGFFQLGRP